MNNLLLEEIDGIQVDHMAEVCQRNITSIQNEIKKLLTMVVAHEDVFDKNMMKQNGIVFLEDNLGITNMTTSHETMHKIGYATPFIYAISGYSEFPKVQIASENKSSAYWADIRKFVDYELKRFDWIVHVMKKCVLDHNKAIDK